MALVVQRIVADPFPTQKWSKVRLGGHPPTTHESAVQVLENLSMSDLAIYQQLMTEAAD
jgi:hypothetical protein